MPSTWDGLVVALLLVVPGFAAYYVNQFFSISATERPGDLKLVLLALTANIIILALEAFVLGITVRLVPGLPILLGVNLDELVNYGLNTYIATHPLRAIVGGSFLFLAHLGIMVTLGWFDVVGKHLLLDFPGLAIRMRVFGFERLSRGGRKSRRSTQ